MVFSGCVLLGFYCSYMACSIALSSLSLQGMFSICVLIISYHINPWSCYHRHLSNPSDHESSTFIVLGIFMWHAQRDEPLLKSPTFIESLILFSVGWLIEVWAFFHVHAELWLMYVCWNVGLSIRMTEHHSTQTYLLHSSVGAGSDACTVSSFADSLTFDITTVPNPPTVSFANDIEFLFIEQYSSTKLVVVGHGIPICHWDRFYMKKHKIKPHAWDSLWSTWHNWR